MKICFLSPYPPQTGGIPVHTSKLVNMLSRKHEIFIITYGRLGRKSRNARILEVPVINIKFLRGLSFFIGSLIMLMVLGRRHKIDIVHSHYLHPAGTVAVLYRKVLFNAKKKPKVIVTAHGSDLLSLGKIGLFRGFMKRVGNSCDRLICVSEHLAERARIIGIEKGKIRVVYNGMDANDLPRAGKDALRKKFRLSEKRKIITFAGSLSEAKGSDAFVILAKHLLERDPGLFFVMIGKGPEREWIKKYLKKNKIGDSVFLAGPKTHEETLEYIKSSDVLVVPSLVEGFGLIALEGACLSVPVAATPAGALPEVLSQYSITENLPKTVSDILKSRKFRKKVIERNKALSKKFSWKKVADETESVYESV